MRRTSFVIVALVLTSAVSGLTLRSDARAPEADSAAEWAGVYALSPSSSSMSMDLVITDDSRFRLSMAGCFGTSEVERGSVAYHKGLLYLKPSSTDVPHFPLGSKILIPVRHEGQLYLVTSDRAGAFLNALHTGRLHCRDDCERFFMRESDTVLTDFPTAPSFSRQTTPGTH
jgi:hypothetical protein